jgi:hypothetical protein
MSHGRGRGRHGMRRTNSPPMAKRVGPEGDPDRTHIRFSLSRENIFPGHGVFGVSLTPFSPGSQQRRRRSSVGDPAVSIQGGRDSWPQGPKTSRTQHACGLRRPRSAEQGGCAGEQAPAGPDTRSFPASRPVEKRRAHLRQGRGQLGKARDGGGSSGDCSFLGPRSEGGRVDVGMAPRRQARTTGDGLAPISLRPPTCLRAAAGPPRTIKKSGRGRRPFQASGCRGYDQGHTGADSWSNDNGMSSLWLTSSAPVRRRLAGRPAAQCLTKRWTSKTSLVWSMW